MKATGKGPQFDPVVGFVSPSLENRFFDHFGMSTEKYYTVPLSKCKLDKKVKILVFDSDKSLSDYFDSPSDFSASRNAVPYLLGWIGHVPTSLLGLFKVYA